MNDISIPSLFSFFSHYLKKVLFLRPNGEEWTYGEVYTLAHNLAYHFRRDLSLKEGDVVAVKCGSEFETILIAFGLNLIGIRYLLLPATMTHELITQLKKKLSLEAVLSAHYLPESFFSKQIFRHHPVVEIERHHPLSFIMTSGSSQTSKIIGHTWSNFYFSALGSIQFYRYQPNDEFLLSLPLHHIAGWMIIYRALISGGKIILSDANEKGFPLPPKSHLSLVPSQLTKLLSDGNNIKKLQSLKSLLLGGASASSSLLKTCLQHKIPFSVTYGMTESTAQLCATPLGMKHLIEGSVGHPLPYRQVVITEKGEVSIKGPTVVEWQLIGKELIHFRRPSDLFLTSDLGEFKDENLIILGRSDRVFISGGENINPYLIEEVLKNTPIVLDAYVLSVADDYWGQMGIAVIVSDTNSFSLQELTSILEKHLPRYMIPKKFFITPPKSNTDLKFSKLELEDIIINPRLQL